jgi:molybdate transport system substrate-binding protein
VPHGKAAKIDLVNHVVLTRTAGAIAGWLMVAVWAAAAPALTVAAASDLQSALPAIAAQFEKATGQKVTLTFGSSGNFFTQIQNGAPFDVMMSADLDYPRRLERAGLADPGTLVEYGRGRIVLWSRRDSGIDVTTGLAVLRNARVRTIAIANPAHAPYGRAAVDALKHEQLYDAVSAKLVLGENISQAAQFAQTGSADVGILALSLALSPALKNAGAYAEVPDALYPPIVQAAIVVASSKQKALARQFVDALKKPDALRILQSFGFAAAVPAAR